MFEKQSRIIDKIFRAIGVRDSGGVLSDLLCQDLRDAALPEQMFWLEEVLIWLLRKNDSSPDTRFHFFFNLLDKNLRWKENFQYVVYRILRDSSLLGLLAEVGIAVEHGLWGDLTSRILNSWVPLSVRNNLQEILFRVFRNKERLERLRLVSEEVLRHMIALIQEGWTEELTLKLQKEIDEAVLSLSVHVAHYGIGYSVRTRLSRDTSISLNSFFRLIEALQVKQPSNDIQTHLDACERDVRHVFEGMELSGVSVDVVNRLETISALLSRIRILSRLPSSDPETIREVVLDLVWSCVRSSEVREPIRRHFYLLARKIAERNGHSGEHYFARGKKELWTLFLSACGGGVVVVFMGLLKNAFLSIHPAPLVRAFGIWIIYSVGFLAMQFLGYTLATKIPSFTASRLASLIRGRSNQDDLQKEFKTALVSQGLALLGNLVALAPLALFIGYLLEHYFQITLMDEEYANHTVHGLNPILSYAIPLGALTGGQLWLSSIAGGWFENWLVVRKVPKLLESEPKLQHIFGEEKMKRAAEWMIHHASGIATNIALGFLFGFVPLLGTLINLDWNGHHVTLSSVAAVFAVSSLHFELTQNEWVYGGIGIFLIGFMNFSVSFGLALFVAASSQRMDFWRVSRRLWKRP